MQAAPDGASRSGALNTPQRQIGEGRAVLSGTIGGITMTRSMLASQISVTMFMNFFQQLLTRWFFYFSKSFREAAVNFLVMFIMTPNPHRI